MDKLRGALVPASGDGMLRATIVDQLQGKCCWQAGKYLGSMLYFDFGQRIQVQGRNQRVVERGEASLGIRDCHWNFGDGVHVLADSDTVTDASAARLLAQIQGASLIQIAPGTADGMCFVFSNGWVLALDISNRYGTADDIAEIALPDGSVCGVTPQGDLHRL